MTTTTLSTHDAIQAHIDRIEDAIDREELKPCPDEGSIANARAQIAALEERQKLIASR